MEKEVHGVETNLGVQNGPGVWTHCACMLSHFSHAQLFVTPWTLAHQTPLSIEFSRQEYWSGLPFPSSGDLPDPGIEPVCVSYVSWISKWVLYH